MTRTLTLDDGALTATTEEDIGGATLRKSVDISISESDAAWLVGALIEEFGLVITPQKLLPRTVFEELPDAMRRDLLHLGFQIYDWPENLTDDALEYDITLRARG